MLECILPLLQCPNSGNELECHPLERTEKDIKSGVMVGGDYAYPIVEHVAVLLSDEDADAANHIHLLQKMRSSAPKAARLAIDATIERLTAQSDTELGRWNRDEMAYYDKGVGPDVDAAVQDVRNRDIWQIFLPRQQHMLRHLAPSIQDSILLEIGCGSARTINRCLNPSLHSYGYIGIDISYGKAALGRRAMPSGNFIQASALKIPIRSGVIDATLAFGALHHLPDPDAALRECARVSRQTAWIGAHEPINSPKLIPDGEFRNRVEKALEEYEHSEHDNEISLEASLETLASFGFQPAHIHEYLSIVFTLCAKVVSKFPPNRFQKHLFQLLFLVDACMIQTICRLSRRFGPRGAIFLAKRGR